MTIRKALLCDVISLTDLESRIFSYENFPLSRGSFYYHVKNNLLFLAEIDENIVGYALVLIKRKEPKLYSIAILPSHRKKGISLALINHTVEQLIKLAFETLTLEVRTDNLNAIAVYEYLKFKRVKVIKKFYRDGCDAYQMSVKLDDLNVS